MIQHSTPGYLSKENKHTNLKKHIHPLLTEALFTVARADSLEKILMLGKIECGEEKEVTEDEMVGRHHQLNGREFEQILGVDDGQGGLACCRPWGLESETT